MRATPVVTVLLLSAGLVAQEDHPALLQQGRAQALAQDWPAAIDTLTRALALQPDDVETLRWRGHAFTGAERHDEALADLARALDFDTDDCWTNYAHAMALHHLGQLERAITGYTRALALDPSFVKAFEWRGYTLSLLGDQVRAIADLDRAIAVDRGNPWLRFIRAKAFVGVLDLARAEDDLWRVLDAEPDNADAQAQLGYLKTCIGETEAGIRMLERAVTLDPLGQVEARPWLYHLLTAEGRDDAAAQLDPVLATARPGESTPWPVRIAAFLKHELRPHELVELARTESPSATEVAGRTCEAWLHIGLQRQSVDRNTEATVALARAIATDARDKWEWSYARAVLRRLAAEHE